MQASDIIADLKQIVAEWARRGGHELSADERARLDEVFDSAVPAAVARLSEAERSVALEVERCRLAVDAAGIGLWEWRPDTGCLTWDRRTRELLGVGSDSPVSYESFLESLHPDDRRPVDALIRRKIGCDAFGDEYRAEFRAVRTERWVASSGRIVERDRDRRAIRMMGTVVDTTERKRAEEDLRHAAEFRERFIAIVSHDLRNPLTAIRMAATVLIKSEELPESLARHVRRIHANADRMARMIGDLLDLTRSRCCGGIPVEPKPTSLSQITPGVLENIELTRPGRRVVTDARGDLNGNWDADRLAQAFSNLVMNALDHGDPHAAVRVELLGEDDQVSIVVRNEGEPIAPDDLPHIFEPFRRGAGSGRGLGLGLYIAREIARSHGGDITATSTAAGGTTFCITLPRRSPRRG